MYIYCICMYVYCPITGACKKSMQIFEGILFLSYFSDVLLYVVVVVF